MAGRPSSQIVEVEVHGLDELERAFPHWAHATEAALGDALVQVARITSQVTALRAPVLTGAFARSVTAEKLGTASLPTARVSEGAGLAYGRWLEFGRRKKGGPKKGGRYLLPTARREKRNVKKRLADTTQKEIDSYAWPKSI
jgi:hypothetical protein